MSIIQKTGKVAGRVVNSTKTAPSKTRNILVSAKKNFLDGYRDSDSNNK